MNRREFIGGAAGVLSAASLLVGDEQAKPVAPSDRVNLAIIGAGSRGQQLMRTFLRVPGVRFAGICDVYEPRFAAAKKITGEQTPTYTDYRKLLEARDIDAVYIATPLSEHAEHVTAALESGRPVYGEKSLGLTVEDCNHIVEAVRRSGRVFQIGLQYHYAPWYREAITRIRAGKIGQVTQIYAYWHRNNNWRRPVPAGGDQKLERLINWRLYREYSGGLVAELGSHHINTANDIFDATPISVVGSGGIDYWKDGRETLDNVQVTYRYPAGQTLFFSAITTNGLDGCQLRIYGTGGSAVLTEADATMYYEPRRANSAVPEATVVEHGIVTGASYRAELPYRGPGEPIRVPEGTAGNPDFLACKAFINSVRTKQRPLADEQRGWAEGVAVALGNKAIDEGRRIIFAEHAQMPPPAHAGGA
jgi:predicted dehydrogenase